MTTAGDDYFKLAAACSCESTRSGWVWYCDQHDTHGNADTEDEALIMGQNHVDYHYDYDNLITICAIYTAEKREGEAVL